MTATTSRKQEAKPVFETKPRFPEMFAMTSDQLSDVILSGPNADKAKAMDEIVRRHVKRTLDTRKKATEAAEKAA